MWIDRYISYTLERAFKQFPVVCQTDKTYPLAKESRITAIPLNAVGAFLETGSGC